MTPTSSLILLISIIFLSFTLGYYTFYLMYKNKVDRAGKLLKETAEHLKKVKAYEMILRSAYESLGGK